ncbi:MAG: TrkH family potassium uptake protein [Bacteroidales bacterium]|nr:TrkH family potassium uptake protein [Bacteroidales bacterium]
MNIKVVIRAIGMLVMLECILMLFCLITGLCYGEDLRGFLFSLGISISAGLVGIFSTRNSSLSVGRREGYLIVGIVWVVFSLFGSMPFLFSGCLHSFADALFESMSGFTTTGATTFADIEVLPKQIILWRSLMQWVGGMGIIVFTVAVVPMIGMGGMQLYSAEASGPTKDKIHPRIKDTASRIYLIYIACTILEVILLMCGGMNFFESLILALSSISSGGFSSQNASAMEMSPYTQYVVMFFMFISGVNFVLLYMALRGKFRIVAKDDELKNYIIVVFGCAIAILIINAWKTGTFSEIEHQIRVVLFQVISVITTSGFVITDYAAMPNASKMILFFLTFFGACAGSTSGAIKIVRISVLLKNSYLALKQIVHPNAILTLRMSGKPIESKVISNVYAFIVMYVLIFLLGTLALSFIGHDFYTAFSASALSISNVGIGFCPSGMMTEFSTFPAASKYVMTLLMLIGRLEVFTVLVLFLPSFWKKGN